MSKLWRCALTGRAFLPAEASDEANPPPTPCTTSEMTSYIANHPKHQSTNQFRVQDTTTYASAKYDGVYRLTIKENIYRSDFG